MQQRPDIQRLLSNTQSLAITFNTLQSIIKSLNVAPKGADYPNAVTLHAASQLVRAYYERESILLNRLQGRQHSESPRPSTPPVPEDFHANPSAVKETPFYKILWGSSFK